MICKPCSTAGDLNKRALGLLKEDKRRDADGNFERARFFHDDCVGCDCQHVVGERLHD